MAAGHLPTLTLTSYNSYIFPYDIETTSYRVEPLRDPARRTVWACKFAISLRWYDHDPEGRGGSLEARSRDMTARLTKDAGELKYESRGFGNPPAVNGGSRVRDVDWGPRAGPLELKPHGGTTVECSWSVEFTLPTCDDGVFNGIAWFNYSLQFARDAHGYTTRTYTAKLRIAQTKPTVDSRVITDSADRYFESVVPALLPGFRRERADRTLSEDKCELAVTVVDAQMPPVAPPKGVVLAESNHSYQSNGIIEWVGTISATYDVPFGSTALDAVKAFLELVADRRKRAELATPFRARPSDPARTAAIPVSASASEPDIYGRTQVRLSLTYKLTGPLFVELLSSGGLWTPVPKAAGGDWAAWATSIPSVLSPRGHARLTFTPGEDKIIDLCRAGAPTAPGPGAPPAGSGALASVLGAAAGAVAGAAGLTAAVAKLFPKPTPDASWMSYSPRLLIVADSGRVPVTTLPESPLSSAPRQIAQGAWDAYNGPLPNGVAGSPGLIPGLQLDGSGTGETTVQQRTKPNFYVIFTGTALRAHYPIPCPELLNVNGRKPTLVGQPQFETFTAPGSLTPVTCARWALTYLFTDDQGGAPTQPIGPVPTSLA